MLDQSKQGDHTYMLLMWFPVLTCHDVTIPLLPLLKLLPASLQPPRMPGVGPASPPLLSHLLVEIRILHLYYLLVHAISRSLTVSTEPITTSIDTPQFHSVSTLITPFSHAMHDLYFQSGLVITMCNCVPITEVIFSKQIRWRIV